MKIVNIMVFFLLQLLILSHITTDIYKLFITLFLLLLALKQSNKRQVGLLILTFLADYFLAYQQDSLWGLYFFILMQWLYFGEMNHLFIFLGLLLPLPLIYRLAFVYVMLLLLNIGKYKETRGGFILLLISDLFVVLFYYSQAIIWVYLTWWLYVPALLLIYRNVIEKEDTSLLIEKNYGT